MESDWVRFFELVGRLQAVSPHLVDLALRYGHGKDREVLEEVERELSRGPGGEKPRESFFDPSRQAGKVNLRRCQDFLGDLRKHEDQLREMQIKATQELLQVQAARRAFEETLKEMLRAEHRSIASDEWAERCATEGELVAGLHELKEQGGLELHQFIGELEGMVQDRERAGK
jgi:hypothetical protein